MIDFKLIGSRIRKARKHLNISQEVLSERLDISTVYLSKVENGKVNASIDLLYNISTYLDIEPATLIYGTNTDINTYLTPEIKETYSLLNTVEKKSVLKFLQILTDLQNSLED